MGHQRSDAFGGSSGQEFADSPVEGRPLRRIVVRAGHFIDSIQPEWEGSDERETTGPRHGGSGGEEYVVELRDGEVITRITGRAGYYVDQLTFHTNKRRKFGPYGGDGGEPFEASGLRLVGFYGAAHDYVDRLGFVSEEAARGGARKKAAPKAEVTLTAEERPKPKRGAAGKPKAKAVTGTAKRRAE